MPTPVNSPMPLITDVVFPSEWALASGNPFPASPLQQYDPNGTYAGGYSPPTKLPGLTTPSGTLYAASGVNAIGGVAMPNQHTANQLSGDPAREESVATFYDTFGGRTAVASSGTANGKIGPSPASVLQTGSIQQRFSDLPDPNTGQPAWNWQ